MGEYVKQLVTLLIIVNPIGAAPLFLSLTTGLNINERARVARRAASATTLILLGTLIGGRLVLDLFGISVASFRVIGGILLLLLALDMLRAKPRSARITPEEEDEAGMKPDVAIVPLGIPMLAGPGAISSVILYTHPPFVWSHYATIVIMILITGALSWIVLRLAAPIGLFLGTTGVNVLTRLMGIVIGATSIEYMVAGLRELLPVLARHN